MAEVCSQCGLPQDLCICEVIAREQQKIEVKIERRKFGKKYTIITGIKKEANISEITKKLKVKLAAYFLCFLNIYMLCTTIQYFLSKTILFLPVLPSFVIPVFLLRRSREGGNP